MVAARVACEAKASSPASNNRRRCTEMVMKQGDKRNREAASSRSAVCEWELWKWIERGRAREPSKLRKVEQMKVWMWMRMWMRVEGWAIAMATEIGMVQVRCCIWWIAHCGLWIGKHLEATSTCTWQTCHLGAGTHTPSTTCSCTHIGGPSVMHRLSSSREEFTVMHEDRECLMQ